jgi:hypothetical protein|tara:strand:- start:765 stop:1115 length:351 start_codon:yes stop_codon:yes gene_type:complete
MYYKQDEIQTHIDDYLIENKEYIKENLNRHSDINELHHEIFNTDYYIIGTYEAKKWCGKNTFEIIETIKEYEQFNFGEVTTDFSSAESVVNMYTYIVGEELLYKMEDDLREQELII